jgi:hypothetical protein
MALIVIPKESAETLLKQIKDTMNTPAIITWSMDSDGDFTHTPHQWKSKAWFRPSVQGSELVFIFLGRQKEITSKEIYAVYHGRFIEMLLAHFDVKFSSVQATALPARGDLITTMV